uniref:Odorant binding protein n=1 Tax=Glyphodes pyloalis TaxID=1242752 RepID=A0A6M3GVG4_GLYPY|nr:odorant binding protein [Glyphodes pyloalis]
MLGLVIPAVLVAVFQGISCQGPPPPFPPNVPEQCRRPPEGVAEKPHECCKIPPFFAETDFEECGFKKLEDESPPKHHGPPDCTKQICMLKKYNLVKEDESIDHDAVAAFVDKWSEANADFKAGMDKAKERCIGKQLPGPPHICEANRIVFCISSTVFSECPKWEESEGCQKLKSHLEECSPHFPK